MECHKGFERCSHECCQRWTPKELQGCGSITARTFQRSEGEFLSFGVIIFPRNKNPSKELLTCTLGMATMDDGRNPAPVDMVYKYPHLLQGFIHVRWCRISSINSMDEEGNYNFTKVPKVHWKLAHKSLQYNGL